MSTHPILPGTFQLFNNERTEQKVVHPISREESPASIHEEKLTYSQMRQAFCDSSESLLRRDFKKRSSNVTMVLQILRNTFTIIYPDGVLDVKDNGPVPFLDVIEQIGKNFTLSSHTIDLIKGDFKHHWSKLELTMHTWTEKGYVTATLHWKSGKFVAVTKV